MSFQPVLPLGGYTGWRFLQRTLAQQEASHAAAPAAQRDEAYFRENIAAVQTAEDLVSDRRLLRVALTAFGLGDDVRNRAYVKKVLESSTIDPTSFVNRLSDDRYKQMASAFGLGEGMLPLTGNAGFADRILASYRERRFEEAVGEQDETMRLALSLERDLGRLAGQASSEATKWYKILGTPALREVFETAFNLPSSFGSIDVDQQVEILRARTERLTGADTVSQFTGNAALDALTKRFFLAGQVAQIQSVSGQSAALTLLQSGQATLSGVLGR